MGSFMRARLVIGIALVLWVPIHAEAETNRPRNEPATVEAVEGQHKPPQKVPQKSPPRPTPRKPSRHAWTGRGYISVNGGYQPISTDFRTSTTLTINVEQGSFDTGYQVKSGMQFDVGGGVRLWRNLAAGIAISRFTKTGDGTTTARVPHPFFFNQLREVSGVTSGLKREELAVHMHGVWLTPLPPRFSVAFFGGPSFFNVEQTIVSDFQYQDSYPYDTATFSGATRSSRSKSKLGFNVGADVGYFFSQTVGVGGTVRFAHTSVELPAGEGQTVSLDAGGPLVGVGLRLRF